jgi:hypothetical protein
MYGSPLTDAPKRNKTRCCNFSTPFCLSPSPSATEESLLAIELEGCFLFRDSEWQRSDRNTAEFNLRDPSLQCGMTDALQPAGNSGVPLGDHYIQTSTQIQSVTPRMNPNPKHSLVPQTFQCINTNTVLCPQSAKTQLPTHQNINSNSILNTSTTWLSTHQRVNTSDRITHSLEHTAHNTSTQSSLQSSRHSSTDTSTHIKHSHQQPRSRRHINTTINTSTQQQLI